MGERRVVITGMGAITPIGLDHDEFWAGLCEGRSGAKTITHVDTEGIACKIGATIYDYDADKHFDRKAQRKNERFMQFAMVAGREAVKHSGYDLTEEKALRSGVIVGCGIGGLTILEEQSKVYQKKGARRISPMMIPKMIANMAAGMVSIDLGFKGPNFCVVTACASAAHSIGEAMHIIKRGEADVMVAGGTEACITQLGLAGFTNMQALTTRNDDPEHASRPFDKGRDGFLMGEGAGLLFLEELESAKARGAVIHAELVGYGMSADAYHITAPASDGSGGARAMQAALDSAKMNPEDIDCINAHGTSTILNDQIETRAIKTVFGDHASKLAVTSNKSMIGHLLGAAGGVEAIASVLTIKNSLVTPTMNYETPDPECDLDYVPNKAREMKVRAVASNSLGFGGHNCTVIIKEFNG